MRVRAPDLTVVRINRSPPAISRSTASSALRFRALDLCVFPHLPRFAMPVSGVNRTILHVDDDPQFTRIVAHLLQHRGYDVVSLSDPQEALGELVRHGYRIVILDIDMPGVDGIELMRQIKEFDGGIQVIMLTGLVTLSNAMAAFRR